MIVWFRNLCACSPGDQAFVARVGIQAAAVHFQERIAHADARIRPLIDAGGILVLDIKLQRRVSSDSIHGLLNCLGQMSCYYHCSCQFS